MKLLLPFSGSQCKEKKKLFSTLYILKPTFDTCTYNSVIPSHFCLCLIRQGRSGSEWVCALWPVGPSLCRHIQLGWWVFTVSVWSSQHPGLSLLSIIPALAETMTLVCFNLDSLNEIQ